MNYEKCFLVAEIFTTNPITYQSDYNQIQLL